MKKTSDAWYVRLPDGRILRASSTGALRNHIGSGRIPADSLVRKTQEEEWVTLEWSREFGDLVVPTRPRNAVPPAAAQRPAPQVPPADAGGVASRLDPLLLHTVGVRGLVDELLAAMDNTLMPNKLLVACIAGVLGGAVLVVADPVKGPVELSRVWWLWVVVGAAFLILGAVCDALLTQMTYVEVSRLRPARWSEAAAGLFGFALRLMLAYVVAAGGAVLAIILLRLLPTWLAKLPEPAWLPGVYQYGAGVIAIGLEMVLWPVLGFALLLAPIMVVEECSVLGALAHWWSLIRQHLGRLFLYEGLAIALGVLFTLPFAVPLALTALGRLRLDDSLSTPTGAGLCILGGMAAAPLIAYLAVANMFIYLNLRYEVEPRR